MAINTSADFYVAAGLGPMTIGQYADYLTAIIAEHDGNIAKKKGGRK